MALPNPPPGYVLEGAAPTQSTPPAPPPGFVPETEVPSAEQTLGLLKSIERGLPTEEQAQRLQGGAQLLEANRRANVTTYGTDDPKQIEEIQAQRRTNATVASVPRVLRPLALGGLQSATSTMSTLQRPLDAVFGTNVADELNREVGRISQAQLQLGDSYLERMGTGIVNSMADMLTMTLLPGAGASGAGGIGALQKIKNSRSLIAGFTAKGINSAVTTGRDAGLTGTALASYAASHGAMEGLFMAAATAAGMPGIEALPFAKNLSQGLVRRLGTGIMEELPEELLTTIYQTAIDGISGVDPKARENLPQALLDTIIQTVGTVGLANTVAGRARQPETAQPVQTAQPTTPWQPGPPQPEPVLSPANVPEGPTVAPEAQTPGSGELQPIAQPVETPTTPAETPVPTAPAELPGALAEAKLRYRVTDGGTSKGVTVVFDDPAERAVYVASQPRKGKLQKLASDYLIAQGFTPERIAQEGQALRERIKQQATGFTGEELRIGKQTPVAPVATEPAATPAPVEEKPVPPVAPAVPVAEGERPTPPAAAPTPAAAPQAEAKLPPELAGAKPRYAIGQKSYLPSFSSDIDKALFITGQVSKSARDADYRAFLEAQGLNDQDIARGGVEVRAKLREMAKDDSLRNTPVPKVWGAEQAAVQAAQTETRQEKLPGVDETVAALDAAKRYDVGLQVVKKLDPAQDRIRKAFLKRGTRIVFFEGSNALGFRMKRHPQFLFVRADQSFGEWRKTVLHEFVHELHDSRPALFKELMDAIPTEDRKRIIAWYDSVFAERTGNQAYAVHEEGVTTPVGEIAVDERVWQAMLGEKPDLRTRLREFFDQFLRKLGLLKTDKIVIDEARGVEILKTDRLVNAAIKSLRATFEIPIGSVSATVQKGETQQAPTSGIQKLDKAIQTGKEIAGEGPVSKRPVEPRKPGVEGLDQTIEEVRAMLAEDLGVQHSVRGSLRERGDLPAEVAALNAERIGSIASESKRAEFALKGVIDAVKQDYGKHPRNLPPSEVQKLDDYLKGKPVTLSPGVATALDTMRQHVDTQTKRLITSTLIDPGLAKILGDNLGQYLNRSYRVFDDPKWLQKIPFHVLSDATVFIEAQLRAQGRPVAQAQTIVEEMLQDWKQGGVDTLFKKEAVLGSKRLTILKGRQEIAPEIRALMGEYTNPFTNYSKTIAKQATLLANQTFLENVKNVGLNNWLFTDDTAKSGFTTRIAAPESSAMAPLNGLRTSPEIAEAFLAFNKNKQMQGWAQALLAVNYIAKSAKTVYSGMTQARNLLGQPLFALASGHFRIEKGLEAFKAMKTELTNRGPQAMQDYIARLHELGILGNNVNANELMADLRDMGIQDTDLYSESGFLPAVKRGLKRTLLDAPQGLYRVSDAIGKVYGFENEVKRQKAINPSATQDQVETIAAERVLNTYPSYSKVPPAVQAFRRQPFIGPFVAFWYESIRTIGNSMIYGYQDLVQGKNAAQKRAGAERLVGTLLAVGGPIAAAAITAMRLGMSDDDEEAFREFQPEWSKGNVFAFLDRDDKGVIKYMDMSALNPYSTLTDPINSIIAGQGEPLDRMTEAAGEFIRPMTSDQIFTKVMAETYTNRKKDTGGRVYNPEDSLQNQWADRLAHVFSALEPGTLTRIRRRILPGLRGEETSFGEKIMPGEEIAAEATGLKMRSFNFASGLGFQGRRFTEASNDISNLFLSELNRPGSKDETIVDAYRDSEARRFEKWNDLHRKVNAARRSGLDTRELYQALVQGGVGPETAKAVIQGVYKPYDITSPAVKAAFRTKKGKIPLRELVPIYQSSVSRKLGEGE